ncbi:VWA domain-containing protein [Shewanella avicenniae]|uniref:VWA domain-containing protein n=1 Tax=Shewanella avicenniae TaxID=2814294 RepID=A0ABX7QVY4_9GAMM|nr:VIT and VWA domain-containing protein [Shewanella avicenniae]QSX34806.1 VWA domain-containing protein [Shewanella avicenniae]
MTFGMNSVLGQAPLGFNGDIVLRHTAVAAQLNGAINEVQLTHEFINQEDDWIEAVYTFALPLDAVILGLTLTLAEQVLVANIVAKSEGEQTYEDAITDGDSAVLLTQIDDGLYSLNVGNLQPQDKVSICIQYAQVLRWQDHGLRFYFPCTIGERYGDASAAGLEPQQQIEHALDNGARMSFSFRVQGALADARVACPSHSLTQQMLDNCLELSAEQLIPDRDIIINLAAPRSFAGELLVEQSEFGTQYCANLLLPEFDQPASRAPQCFQFVIDCSGSMLGDSMQQVRKALRAIKTLLLPDDYFNLVLFGSDAEALFAQPVKAEAAALRHLADQIEQIDAIMGGTHMLTAFEKALQTGVHPELSTQILLITDGEIWESSELLKLANRAQMRVFSIGVGSAVNEALLTRLSRDTGAEAVFVSPNESMADAIVSQFRRSRFAVLDRIAVSWPTPAIELPVPNVCFSGDGYQRYAHMLQKTKARKENASEPRAIEPSALPATVAVTLHKQQQQLNVDIPVRHFSGIANATLARLAAKQRLPFITVAEFATAEAVKYALLSEHTSCVLVAERESKSTELPQLRSVKHTRPVGEMGFGSAASPVHHDVCYSSAPLMSDRQFAPMDVAYSGGSGGAPRDIVRPLEQLNYMDIPAFLRKSDTDIAGDNEIDPITEFEDDDSPFYLTDAEPDEWLSRLLEAVDADCLQLNYLALERLGIDLDDLLALDFYPDVDEPNMVYQVLCLFIEITNAGRQARPLRHWLKQQLQQHPELATIDADDKSVLERELRRYFAAMA